MCDFLFFLCLAWVFVYRREQWHLFSSYATWQHLVAQTRRQARDHAVLSDIYANTVIQRLNQVTEEVQRIYRRVSWCTPSHPLFFSLVQCSRNTLRPPLATWTNWRSRAAALSLPKLIKKNKRQKKKTNVGRRELSQTAENNSDWCACVSEGVRNN